MAKYNLRQHYRGEDGKLYRAGNDVEVPKKARLKLSSEDSTATRASSSKEPTSPPAGTQLPQEPTGGTTADDGDGEGAGTKTAAKKSGADSKKD